MSDSILECSGGHWLRAAITWFCLTVAILFGLARGHADDKQLARAPLPSATASSSATIAQADVATVINWETRTSVTHRVTAFDFNAARPRGLRRRRAHALSNSSPANSRLPVNLIGRPRSARAASGALFRNPHQDLPHHIEVAQMHVDAARPSRCPRRGTPSRMRMRRSVCAAPGLAEVGNDAGDRELERIGSEIVEADARRRVLISSVHSEAAFCTARCGRARDPPCRKRPPSPARGQARCDASSSSPTS